MEPPLQEIDYLTVYLNSPYFNVEPSSLLALLMLGLMRVLPIVAIAPFFGAKNLNRPAKVALGCVLVLIIFPHLLMVSKEPLQWDLSLIFLGMKELFIGIALGLFVSLPFHLMESAGIIFDFQRGASSLMATDPLLSNQNAPTGVLFNLVAVNIFFMIGGPFIFMEALIQSYTSMPPDQLIDRVFFQPGTPFYNKSMSLLNIEMTVAVQMVAPALITMLMTDMFLGVANRLAPQVMITFLGMPLKSWLGIVMVWLGWFILGKQFIKLEMDWLLFVKELVQWFGFH